MKQKRNILWVVLLALIMTSPIFGQARQSAILVGAIVPTDGTNPTTGVRLVTALRRSFAVDGYVALDDRTIDRMARNYGLRSRDLTCTSARQLAQLEDVPFVMCGEYTSRGNATEIVMTLYSDNRSAPHNGQYTLEPITVTGSNYSEMVALIEGAFQRLSIPR